MVKLELTQCQKVAGYFMVFMAVKGTIFCIILPAPRPTSSTCKFIPMLRRKRGCFRSITRTDPAGALMHLAIFNTEFFGHAQIPDQAGEIM